MTTPRAPVPSVNSGVVEARDGLRWGVGVVFYGVWIAVGLLLLRYPVFLFVWTLFALNVTRSFARSLRRVRIDDAQVILKRRDGAAWVHARSEVGALGLRGRPVTGLGAHPFTLRAARLVVFDPSGGVVRAVRAPWVRAEDLADACRAAGIPWIDDVPFEPMPMVPAEEQPAVPAGSAGADRATELSLIRTSERSARFVKGLLIVAVVAGAAVVATLVLGSSKLLTSGLGLVCGLSIGEVIHFAIRRTHMAAAETAAEHTPWRPVDAVVVRRWEPWAGLGMPPSRSGRTTAVVLIDTATEWPQDIVAICDTHWRLDRAFEDGRRRAFLLCIDEDVRWGLLATPDRSAVVLVDRRWYGKEVVDRRLKAMAAVNTPDARLSGAGWAAWPHPDGDRI